MSAKSGVVRTANSLVSKAVEQAYPYLYRASLAALALDDHDYNKALAKAAKKGILVVTSSGTPCNVRGYDSPMSLLSPRLERGQGGLEFLVILALLFLAVVVVVGMLDGNAIAALSDVAVKLTELAK